MVTLRAVIRIQGWLLWREFHSSPNDNHAVVYTANPTTTRDSSFKGISEAKNLWLLACDVFGRFLHAKLKMHLKTLQYSQVPATPVHQTQTSDTDWAHSITTSLMPGLAGLSIYSSLAFLSSPWHTAGSPAPWRIHWNGPFVPKCCLLLENWTSCTCSKK